MKIKKISVIVLTIILTCTSYNQSAHAHRVAFDRSHLQAALHIKAHNITLTQNSAQNIAQIKTNSGKAISKTNQVPEQTQTNIQDLLKTTAEKKTAGAIFLLLFLAFIAGIITSFTPCVYPMIPITIGVLQAQAAHTFKHNLFSAISYVTGIALVYASLGYASAKASILFGRWTASPWVIGLIILFFLYLAFSMFDFYDIYIPGFLAHKTEIQTRGSLLKIFFFGVISGTVASPCLTPALALLLGVAAKQGNPVIGFLTLFFFSLGMGLILVIIGTFSGALALLPQSGLWLLTVKKAMGFIMLAACVHFLHTNIGPHVGLMLYALVSTGATIYFLIFEKARNIVTYLLAGASGACALIIIGLMIKNMLS